MTSTEPGDVWPSSLSIDIQQRLFLRPLSELVARLKKDRRLELAWHLVEREYSDSNLTLDAVAIESGVNKNHLNVLLRQRTGLTFHQLLIRYRLGKALGMMKGRDYNILEIALENGFGSLNTFERNFRVVLRTTPGEFRRQYFKPLHRDFR